MTAKGREATNIDYTAGVAYGHEKGDLGESSLHVMMVKMLRRYFEQAFKDDPHSLIDDVKTYYEADGYRFDVVCLNERGEIVVVGRQNDRITIR